MMLMPLTWRERVCCREDNIIFFFFFFHAYYATREHMLRAQRYAIAAYI